MPTIRFTTLSVLLAALCAAGVVAPARASDAHAPAPKAVKKIDPAPAAEPAEAKAEAKPAE